jgi:hypothetical protein
MSVVERYKVQFVGGPLADVERWELLGVGPLMGGSINGTKDWEHLKKDFGITHVLNLETEHDDAYLGPPEVIGQLPTPDNGQFKNPDWFVQGVAFAQHAERTGRLYLHCQAGGSRTPGMLYAILRHRYKYEPQEALDLIRTVKPSFGTAPYHSNYIASAEVALLALKAIDP